MKELLLSEIPLHKEAVIVRIGLDNPRHYQKLLALGITIGATITVHRCSPQYVISVGNTLIGLDQQLACAIMVTLA